MSIIPTHIVSALNNYNSITPIVTKDLVENCGRTIMAYRNAGEKTKKYEATEKFVESNMSSILWYGAIPATKKIFDITAFKMAKLNPNVSLKFLDNANKIQTIENINKKIDLGLLPKTFINKKNEIDTKTIFNNISKNITKYKGLHITRLLLSTSIPTILSALFLPKAIMALTEYNINKKEEKANKEKSFTHSFKHFQEFKTSKNKISFKSLTENLIKKATEAQSSLLGDMVVVDMAISGSRIYYANKREKNALNGKKTNAPYAAALEKLLTEAGFLYIIYFGGKHIKSLIDKITKNNLDSLILEDKNFIEELKTGAFKNNPLKEKNEEEILNFIDKNINSDENVFIKYAKKTKLIETVKDKTGKTYRNPLKYLDTKNLQSQFEIISNEAKKFVENGNDNIENYVLKKIKSKRIGTFSNLIISSFCVAYILPKFTYIFRKWYTGNSEEPGINSVINKAESKK